ncbi:uncharacterized protein LOC131628343 isoform X2 [Vicia villosa]|uniref:uncharacterized protein LOC131628343 isoform X2 n=1 Tax=Vicia villosa TaxID=3911 RepID=UPI00273B0BDF|nr:uncharacterized protein LOC131628343 isoform X2 [Vicia villosa]
MADKSQYDATPPSLKRKYDEPPPHSRPTGFSKGPPPPSYNNVPSLATTEFDNMPEIQSCSSQSESEEVRPNNRSNSGASETMSYSSSQFQKPKPKNKGILCKRRNPRVTVRCARVDNVAATGFPLGMSFAAVMAQVLYKRDVAADSMSPSHLSLRAPAFISELLQIIPNAHYFKRGTYDLKKIVEYANNKDFTSTVVVHTNHREPSKWCF